MKRTNKKKNRFVIQDMKQLRNIRKKGVEHMNDYEFRALLRLIVGPRAKKIPEYVESPYTERSDNPTPSGADYSVAYYFNEEGIPCVKEEAVSLNIVEYKRGGKRINETHALLGKR
jgi:hypothetical protein